VVRKREARQDERAKQLMQAGFSSSHAVKLFGLARLLSAMALAFAAYLTTVKHPDIQLWTLANKLLLIGISGLWGMLLPNWLVERRRRAYQRNLRQAVPDLFDFVLICVEAGQSIDMAFLYAARELQDIHPEMSAALANLNETLAAGGTREQAFSALAHETGNEDLRQFGTMILQSTRMGTPIAQGLRVFGADLRDRRVREIEEKANSLPTKITLCTMLFTVPPLLIVLLAPALVRIQAVL